MAFDLGGMLGGIAMGGLGAVGSIFGQKSANEANARMAENANLANAMEAEKNRYFQERMRNSAYQAQVADLKAAGLNPILGMGSGGASAPSGSMATAQAARAENTMTGLAGGLSTAVDAARLSKELDQTGSQIAVNKANIATAETQQQLNVNSAKAAAENANNTRQNTIKTSRENHIASGTIDKLKKAADISADTDLKKSSIDNKAVMYDAIMNRAGQAAGVIKDAIGAFKPNFNFGGAGAPQREKWKNRDEQIEDQRQENLKKAKDLFRSKVP